AARDRPRYIARAHAAPASGAALPSNRASRERAMPERPLGDIKACVFDAYGTLFDFASAARACPDVPCETAERLTALWRAKQVQYTWLRAAQGRHADFRQVTADALDFARARAAGIARPPARSLPPARSVYRGAGGAGAGAGGRIENRDPVERHSGHARFGR